jgi:hypothetical protein
LINSTKKYRGIPYQTWWKWTRTANFSQRNEKISKKKVAQDLQITNFARQAAIFNGASMEAIT